MKLLIFSLLGFSFLSCQKTDTKENKTFENSFIESKNPRPKETGELKIEVIPLPQPNDYEVKITWAALEKDPSHWSIIRHSPRKEIVSLATLPREKREYIDRSHLVAGVVYTYFVKALDSDESHFFLKAEVQIPKDLEIKQKAVVSEITGYRRLFLRKEGRILPQFENLRIDVQEILSQEGVIQNFESKQEANLGIPGRSGGLLWIRAQKASGILHVVGNGERGGQGLPGAQGLMGTPGTKGLHGLAAISFPNFKNPSPGNFHCTRPPTTGGPGAIGGMGGPGGVGAKGGDSGRLYIEIENPSGFQLKDVLTPGEGGLAGKGGEGGLGGIGGPPGDLDEFGVCPRAETGPMGPRGKEGLPGENGKSGDLGPKCLKLANIFYGDCESFLTQKWYETNR